MTSPSHLKRTLISADSINRMRSILRSDKLSILPSSQMISRIKHIQNNIGENKPGRSKKTMHEHKKARKAAVLVPICTINGVPFILFTKRSAHMPTHPSQISFPGGHLNPGETEEQAALREMQEECPGNYPYEDASSILILGKTEALPAMNGTMVTPVVAVLTRDLGPSLEHVFEDDDAERTGGEVDQIFVRSIQELVDSEKSEKVSWLTKTRNIHDDTSSNFVSNLRGKQSDFGFAPIFPGREGKIWGLTAFILRPILKSVLVPTFSLVKQKQVKKESRGFKLDSSL